jgi:Tol biopolymer transport system component
MSLAPGARIGVYQVASLIGAGGMGEVYRARDTRLGRDVALKVLPHQFATDADRLSRFQREAQVLASLNHSGIATIHGLEESNGLRALVLELIEGETLADRLARGPIAVAEALPLARQIAEAVEAAHDNGIVHRDLKPANIKVRDDGTVKVLDFGLAKLVESSAAPADATMSPTITSPVLVTGAGILLGAAAYMSPEQARGRLADRRSDIWSFGCVLYEMVTGRRPFAGEDVADTLALVLRGEPDWTALPEAAPPALHRLLRRMLQRIPKRRLADMADVRIELEEAQSELERPAPRAHDDGAVLKRLRRRTYAFGAIAVVALLTLAGVWAWLASRPAPPPRVVRFTVPLPAGNPGAPNPEISPDARVLAFIWPSDGTLKIWTRPVDASEPRPLTGTDGVRNRIWWSPDSSAIAYIRDGRVWRVSPAGGPSEPLATLADRQAGFVGTWGAAGEMLLAPVQATGGLLRLPAAGGTPVPATTLDPARNERQHAAPQFLPDGRRFLFVALANDPRENAAYVGSLDSPERHPLRGIASEVRYAPSGHLVFVREDVLVAQRFDLETLQLSGTAVPVIEPFTTPRAVGAGFSIAADGTLAYHTAAPVGASLVWFHRQSGEQGTVAPPDRYTNIELSPDEQFVLSDTGSGPTGDVRVWDIKRQRMIKVTDDPANDGVAQWGPDSRMVFRSDRKGAGQLYTRVMGTVSKDELLYESGGTKTPFDWSRDGKYIVYSEAGDLWAISPDTRPLRPVRITESPALDVNAKFSPANSGLIAFQSLESGDDEIYVQSFPGRDFRRQVSNNGGTVPRWSRDGTELFFISKDQQMMSVSIDASGEPGIPRPLFRLPLGYVPGRSYTVASDGRFLLRVGPEPTAFPEINVILNWSSTLASRPD